MTTSSGQGDDGTAKGGPQTSQGAAPEAPALVVIEAFGGIRPMAKTLGLAVSTVQGWKERSAIPANRHDQIRAAARDNKIDLDAEVLRASAGEGTAAQPHVIEGQVVDSKSTAASGQPHDKHPEKAQDKPADKAADKADSKTAGKDAGRPGAPPGGAATASAAAAAPRKGGAFLPGLVAGIVLAVVVAGATVYTQPYWAPLLFGSGNQGSAVTVALADVKAQLAKLQNAMPPNDSTQLAAMSDRLATLETAVSQGAGQNPETRKALDSLNGQLARMTDRMAKLEQDVTAASSLAGTSSSQVASRLSGETKRLDELLSQQSELSKRIATAEKDLSAIESARAGAPTGRETMLLLATLQLRDALQGSGPYEAPMEMLKNLAADDPALTPIVQALELRASTGLPSLKELQARFPEVAQRITAIEVGEQGNGWTAGVLRRLAEAVNLRPVGMVSGDTPTAVAARAEVKLNDGDLAGALAELSALKGAAAEAAASWRSDAEARLAADNAVSKLGALMSQRFASMAGG